MSRSYKKYPFVKDRQSCKWGKRYCNKRVRKTKDIPNGKAYRKITEPWDYIYDYSCTEFKEWVIQSWEGNKKAISQGVDLWDLWHKEKTLDEALIQWKKWYICK